MTWVPSAAAVRHRGSRFKESSQFAAPGVTTARPACHRPYSGGASNGSASGAITWFRPGLLTMFASASSKAGAAGSDQTTGALLPVSGISAPSTFTVVFGSRPGTVKPGLPIATVRWPNPAGTLILRRRASDLEVATFAGAELPGVVNGELRPASARWRSASTRSRAHSCAVSSVSAIGRPEPCLASELEGRHGTREIVGVGVNNRGHTSRDSDSCGAPFNAAPTAVASSATAWPCAHAQQSFRSGSSRNGFAGAAI